MPRGVGLGRLAGYPARAKEKLVKVLYGKPEIDQALRRMARQIGEAMPPGADIAVIGIRSRGEFLAQRLIKLLEPYQPTGIPSGVLDITLYRDDLAEKGPAAVLRETLIDFPISDKYVVLVDDVIYTGRSVRAALTALAEFGRAKATRLAVLVDRPARELPIQPDFFGWRTQPNDGLVEVKLEETDGVDAVELP